MLEQDGRTLEGHVERLVGVPSYRVHPGGKGGRGEGGEQCDSVRSEGGRMQVGGERMCVWGMRGRGGGCRREGVTDLSIPSNSFLCVRDTSADAPNAPCETPINHAVESIESFLGRSTNQNHQSINDLSNQPHL